MNHILEIPELALIALIGISGAGKTHFAHRHFLETEIISSDRCRGLISDNENDQSITAEAFDLVYTIAEKRLSHGKLTVLDATHVQPDSRQRILALAKAQNLMAVAIVLDLPLELCESRNAQRLDRQFGDYVLQNQYRQLKKTLKRLKKEGFRQIHILRSLAEVETLSVKRVPLWTNKKTETGPFDIIGDVHGCCDELEALLSQLGYQSEAPLLYRHPAGRRAFFVGDLIDRGPRNLDALRLAKNMCDNGQAMMVPGNHEQKFLRFLLGKKVKVNHGLEKTAHEFTQLSAEAQAEFSAEMIEFIDGLVSHFVLDGGRLVVAHAGMKETFQGRASGRVRSFALYGETSGEIDSFGLPVRLNWAREYRGAALVVYGHVPVPDAEFVNDTIDIDTGCVFGGKLTALRYPERDIVQVPAAQVYYEPLKPLIPLEAIRSAQQAADEILDWSEITGKQILHSRVRKSITVQAENAAAAAEVLSRFAVDPRWLIYLPPTMSPCESAKDPEYLEHPQEALNYYRSQGMQEIIAQEKHMGSRAIIVLCQQPEVAVKRFALPDPAWGEIYTRTGRAFFKAPMQELVLKRLARAAEDAGLWESLQTNWMLLDAEILPWSAKAGELIQNQYVGVGLAARGALGGALELVQQGLMRFPELIDLQQKYQQGLENILAYEDVYSQYCWPVQSPDDLRIAPFHLLASEGQAYTQKSHLWHLEQCDRLHAVDTQFIQKTVRHQLHVNDPNAVQALLEVWLKLTESGGEGMVIKALDFMPVGKKGYTQPALKVRGKEYLRLIYGPNYTEAEHIKRLKKRAVGRKRSLAMREFALGIEALEAFVNYQSLRKVHAYVAGVLAMESETVDPRL